MVQNREADARANKEVGDSVAVGHGAGHDALNRMDGAAMTVPLDGDKRNVISMAPFLEFGRTGH